VPPLRPVSIYPDTGHHDDGTPCVTDGQRVAERLTVARFGRDRRAPRAPSPGAPMPYAHRPASADTGPKGRADPVVAAESAR